MTEPRDRSAPGRVSPLVVATICAALLFSAPARAERMPIPPDLQMLTLLKVLTFDRSSQHKFKTAMSIGVIFVPTDPDSVQAKDAIVKTLTQLAARTTFRNLPIKTVLIPFTTAKDFPADLKRVWQGNNVNVFYVAPGSAALVAEIVKLSRAQGVTTVTGVPEYVNQGIAIGIEAQQNQPKIVINLPSSKSEGTEFDASLLRIARVVK